MDINLLFSVDRNYWQHLAVALLSVLENIRDSTLNVIVVVDARNAEYEAKLCSMLDNFPFARISFVVMDETKISHFRVDDHITLASYFRLFIPDLIDASIKKVIYLDSDIIVRQDIFELWGTDVSSHYLAAVPDTFASNRYLDLGLDISQQYFNAGVLVINVERWRSEGLVSVFVDFINANKEILRFHDQDTLNAVLKGGILVLGFQWNFQARMGSLNYDRVASSRADFFKLRKNAAVIHYTTEEKPWNSDRVINYRELYFRALAKTPWQDNAITNKSLKAFLIRNFRLNNLWRHFKWFAPGLAWRLHGLLIRPKKELL